LSIREDDPLGAEGIGGELRYSYQWAAQLGVWTLEQSPGGWVIQAQIVRRNSYWLEQRPLSLVLYIGNLRWTWRDVELTGDTIHVSSAPEEGVVDATERIHNPGDTTS
jgi:hypothetical protein